MAAYQAGHDPSQREGFLKDNLGLVYHLAFEAARRTGLDSEDLAGVGKIGLIRAYNKFDESRGNAFSTHAAPWIRGAIMEYVSKEFERSKRELSILDAPRGDGDSVTLHTGLADPDAIGIDESVASMLEGERLHEEMRKLPEREQVAVWLRYFEELSYREIGDVMGTTGSEARQKCGSAIRNLRERLSPEVI